MAERPTLETLPQVAIDAANGFANTVDGLQPQPNLSVQLPDLPGITLASHQASNNVPDVTAGQGRER